MCRVNGVCQNECDDNTIVFVIIGVVAVGVLVAGAALWNRVLQPRMFPPKGDDENGVQFSTAAAPPS